MEGAAEVPPTGNEEEHMTRLLHALLVCALMASCSDEVVPSRFTPITDDQVAALGLTQGVAGNTAKRIGDCMPGPPPNTSCQDVPLDASLWLVPEAKADAFTFDHSGARCFIQVGQPTDVDAIVVTNLESGRYGLEVDAGRYMPMIVEANGCGTCVRMSVNDTYACTLIEVEPAKVTKLDLLLDKASH